MFIAAAGISAFLATSALAFSIVKWVGAAYMTWLGVRLLFSRGDSFISEKDPATESGHSIYWQGVLINALNPKVAVFFLALLPQFVVDGAGAVGAQLLLHGALVIVVAAFVEPPLILVGSRLGEWLKRCPRAGLWMDRGLGLLFVTLGVRLALGSK